MARKIIIGASNNQGRNVVLEKKANFISFTEHEVLPSIRAIKYIYLRNVGKKLWRFAMKLRLNLLFILMITIAIFGQISNESLEQRLRQLDSLNFLQQEAFRSGRGEVYLAEIRQMQAIIRTEAEDRRRAQAQVLPIQESVQSEFTIETIESFLLEIIAEQYAAFIKRPLIDRLIISMGAIATLSALFLIFTRILLAILSKRKKKTVQNVKKNKKNKAAPKQVKKQPIAPKPAPKMIIPNTQFGQSTPVSQARQQPNLENAIYSLRELASKYPDPPKNDIYSTKFEEIKIGNTPQPQTQAQQRPIVVAPTTMTQPQTAPPKQNTYIPPTVVSPAPQIEPAPVPIAPQIPAQQTQARPQPSQNRVMQLREEVVKRFDANEDINKIAQEVNLSKDQINMILRLAERK